LAKLTDSASILDLFRDDSQPLASFFMMGPEALGRLVNSHAAGLVLYARQWCATPEDIVQEAFLKLVLQQPPPDNPVSWLYRVVRNGAISAARAARRRRHHESRAAARATGWFDPEAGEALDAETATTALRSLPLEQREIVVAHLWGGLTFEEIAGLAGCSASTAHRWYAAGLATLRERLGVSCQTRPLIRN
jgi:RNA polymerase sigma-70 factor (ECF subfamily)